jgi:hypothetical protein
MGWGDTYDESYIGLRYAAITLILEVIIANEDHYHAKLCRL